MCMPDAHKGVFYEGCETRDCAKKLDFLTDFYKYRFF